MDWPKPFDADACESMGHPVGMPGLRNSKRLYCQTLCVNRNKPKLNCNGKCYLAKKLAEAEKQQQRQAEQDYISSLIYQVMDTSTQYSFGSPSPTIDDYPTPAFTFKSAFLGRLVPESIFHPPLV